MKKLFLLSIILNFSLGCASFSKRRQALEQALGNKEALQQLCSVGESGACALLGQPSAPEKPLAIMQSQTSSRQSRIVVLVPKAQGLAYFLRAPATGAVSRLTPERFSQSGSSWAIDQLEVFNLEPKVEYELVVIGPGSALYDRRKFKTLNVDLRRARIALVSGLDDHLHVEQGKIWTELVAQKPDVIYVLGDGVYADGVPPEQIWNRYADVRSHLEVFKTPHLIPVFAVWNGQDLGKSGGDRSFPGKIKAGEVFHAFFAQKKTSEGFEAGPGTASLWTAFGADFFFLDNRSFRSPNQIDLPDQTHFGAQQEDWITAKVKAAKRPAFLISGDQFFGGYHPFESYEGNHPRRFKSQLDEWKKLKSPLVFLSGGRPLSEILKLTALGYTTYEVTSGPLHAATSHDAFVKDPSPAQMAGAAGQINYLILEIIRAEHNLVRFDVKSFGLDSKLFFQKTLMVKR